jgi:hypothetical protein
MIPVLPQVKNFRCLILSLKFQALPVSKLKKERAFLGQPSTFPRAELRWTVEDDLPGRFARLRSLLAACRRAHAVVVSG